jgi:hypothetical protein
MSTIVNTAATPANNSVLASMLGGMATANCRAIAPPVVGRTAHNAFFVHAAHPSPIAAPVTPMIDASMSCDAMSRIDVAPSALRTASSVERVVSRAADKLATFAQARTRTQHAAPRRIQRRLLRPGSTSAPAADASVIRDAGMPTGGAPPAPPTATAGLPVPSARSRLSRTPARCAVFHERGIRIAIVKPKLY